MRWWFVVVLTACGRIGFDPLGDGRTGDGAVAGGTGETCATARELAVGEMLVDQSLAGARNDIPNVILCPDGVEVVYRVTSAMFALHTISLTADFSGAIVTSPQCPPASGTCTGFVAGMPASANNSFSVGTTYIVIDRGSGTGTTYSLSLQ